MPDVKSRDVLTRQQQIVSSNYFNNQLGEEQNVIKDQSLRRRIAGMTYLQTSIFNPEVKKQNTVGMT